MKFEFTCDECNKYLGDFLYGQGGVEEKAIIINDYIKVPVYNKYSQKIGEEEILANRLPDVICKECFSNNQLK